MLINGLIYLHIFATLIDQISAVNKDFNQSVLTSGKVNHTLGTVTKLVVMCSNMLCEI